MWILTIFWTDGARTKETYSDYRLATLSIEYYIKLAMPKIRHFKLKYRGDRNE